MLKVHVASKLCQEYFEHHDGPIEFGRGPGNHVRRYIVADPYVSQDQLRVEQTESNQIRVENLSRRVALVMGDGSLLNPGERAETGSPLRITLGGAIVTVEIAEPARADVNTAALQTVLAPVDRSAPPEILPPASDSPGGAELARWFERVVAVQQSATSSPDFFVETARAVVELIGLDCGMVLLRQEESWRVAAHHAPEGLEPPPFSQTVLSQMCAERRTFYEASPGHTSAASLLGICAVVAAPILSENQTVIGAVYGARLKSAGGEAIRPLEAQIVQVLAAAVGAGLVRLEREAEVARRTVKFQQFFSEELARELDRDPGMLDGREREVTVMFADIRGFSRISEVLDPAETCRLVGDVMQRLTVRIREHQGVVVDYIGDGLLAMWNAPTDEPQHAILACRAAAAMLDEVRLLDDRWHERIGRPLAIGIGINTGQALVGNIGSLSRFKYGPLGHSVNLASRIESATKHLGVNILITGSTRSLLGDAIPVRRLCRLRVVGIVGAVDLYELPSVPPDATWFARRDTYELGLGHFESGRWVDACRLLYSLLEGQQGQYDLPTLSLVGRAIECLKAPPRSFDAVMELDSK